MDDDSLTGKEGCAGHEAAVVAGPAPREGKRVVGHLGPRVASRHTNARARYSPSLSLSLFLCPFLFVFIFVPSTTELGNWGYVKGKTFVYC